MNKVFPQGDNGNGAAGTKALSGGAEGCSPFSCSRHRACLLASVLLLLATLAAFIALIIIIRLPLRMPGRQVCITLTNRTGFLCHDQRHCIPASRVCDGIRTCAHGEDEDEGLCQTPVRSTRPCPYQWYCLGDLASWTLEARECPGARPFQDTPAALLLVLISPVTECPPCGPGWWRCPSTVFKYCDCIPRSLCRDRVQHCSDWSDEYSCPGP
uniref:Low density lipoprotein receptor class A domain containing 1 n=1 Tax=Otolemur garnettii TaxID=30611 RepID=H0XFM6_OTOGA